MSPKKDNEIFSLEELKCIFINWKAALVAVFGAIVTVGIVCITYATNETKQEARITDLTKRVTVIESVKSDLDTIKTMLRAK
jgi:hypothetical protein